MKVIMTQHHPQLGNPGDVVNVKDGFARNFLIPRKYAIIATPGNLRQVEMIKQRQLTLEEKHKEKLRYISEKIARISVDLVVEVDEEDRLFGTVSPAQIAEALEKQGYSISKKQIIISDPIDSLGVYNVRVQLHPDIESKIRVWVLKREK